MDNLKWKRNGIEIISLGSKLYNGFIISLRVKFKIVLLTDVLHTHIYMYNMYYVTIYTHT